MRIAYVCLDPGVPIFGRKGSSVHCQEIIRAFQKRGCEVELFAYRLGDDIPADLAGIQRNRLSIKLDCKPAAREKTLADLNPRVYQSLSEAGPFDLIYERYALWSFAAMQFAAEYGIPGILEVNAPLIREQKTYRTLVDEFNAKTIRAKCFKYATSLIAVSEQVADQVRQNYFAQNKTTVVANGVNCDQFSPAPKHEPVQDPDKIVIGFVGTLKPWHGVSTLLDAFAISRSKNPNLTLKIVGDGPEREKLEARLNRYPTKVGQSVMWMGAIPNSEVPKVLSTFHIAVAPYPDLQDFYFSPLKILEYMAAGLPVVASRIGQIPSLIEDEATGRLVKSGCEEELASSLLQLSFDQELRTRLGTAARRKVESNHTWHHVVERTLATIPPAKLHCEAC